MVLLCCAGCRNELGAVAAGDPEMRAQRTQTTEVLRHEQGIEHDVATEPLGEVPGVHQDLQREPPETGVDRLLTERPAHATGEGVGRACGPKVATRGHPTRKGIAIDQGPRTRCGNVRNRSPRCRSRDERGGPPKPSDDVTDDVEAGPRVAWGHPRPTLRWNQAHDGLEAVERSFKPRRAAEQAGAAVLALGQRMVRRMSGSSRLRSSGSEVATC